VSLSSRESYEPTAVVLDLSTRALLVHSCSIGTCGYYSGTLVNHSRVGKSATEIVVAVVGTASRPFRCVRLKHDIVASSVGMAPTPRPPQALLERHRNIGDKDLNRHGYCWQVQAVLPADYAAADILIRSGDNLYHRLWATMSAFEGLFRHVVFSEPPNRGCRSVMVKDIPIFSNESWLHCLDWEGRLLF
jgi:hypothetical protein